MNATRAYKIAYPRTKNDNVAAVSAHKLLRNPKIHAYLQKRMQERREKAEINQDSILQELAKMGFADIDPEYIKPADKIKALEVIAKLLGLDKPDDSVKLEQLEKLLEGLKDG